MLTARLASCGSSMAETVSVTAEVAPLNPENGSIKGDVIVQAEIQ